MLPNRKQNHVREGFQGVDEFDVEKSNGPKVLGNLRESKGYSLVKQRPP